MATSYFQQALKTDKPMIKQMNLRLAEGYIKQRIQDKTMHNIGEFKLYLAVLRHLNNFDEICKELAHPVYASLFQRPDERLKYIMGTFCLMLNKEISGVLTRKRQSPDAPITFSESFCCCNKIIKHMLC